MMRKLTLFILLILVLPIIYLSCSKSDDDDIDPPVIKYAKLNVNDTLYSSNVTLKLNDSTNVDHEIDTIVVGKWMYINAGFVDKGKGMSSFKVETNLLYRYEGDAGGSGPAEKYQDSILKINKVGGPIYGKDTISVYRNWLVEIQDSIIRNHNGSLVSLKLIKDDYPLKVVCMDIDGNRDSVIFPVRYVHRSDIYNARLK